MDAPRKCVETGCHFYGCEERLGRCSAHGSLWHFIIAVMHRLQIPSELHRGIVDYLIAHKPTTTTDVVARLGLQPDTVYAASDRVNELVYRLSHSILPPIHCNHVKTAEHYLSATLGRKALRNEDSMRLMQAVQSRNADEHTRLAMAKAFMLWTPDGLNLLGEEFRIAKCYTGQSPLTCLLYLGFTV